jgi:hypothetical protein
LRQKAFFVKVRTTFSGAGVSVYVGMTIAVDVFTAADTAAVAGVRVGGKDVPASAGVHPAQVMISSESASWVIVAL